MVSEEIQKTIYVQHGGQPGHLQAWLSPEANSIANGFFSNVLPVMQNGYIRPRYHGYLYFQDHAGLPLQQCLMGKAEPEEVLKAMNVIYKKSFEPNDITVAV